MGWEFSIINYPQIKLSHGPCIGTIVTLPELLYILAATDPIMNKFEISLGPSLARN